MIRIITLTTMVLILLAGSASAQFDQPRSKDQLKRDFDVVAQNYGALEYAFYTFSLEFERTPKDINELKTSGHLMVKMVDPYTGKDPVMGSIDDPPRQGGLYYKAKDKNWAEIKCYFINPNNPSKQRSLNVEVKIFTHKELKKEVFGDKASRPEKLTRVYLLQLDDAIDSFEQKKGRLPESLDEMSKLGDVNVSYINPFTKKPVKNSTTLSPGDYMYKKFTKKVKGENREFYEVVGWGEKEPVYYFSTDESREEFKWDGDGKASKKLKEFEKADKD